MHTLCTNSYIYIHIHILIHIFNKYTHRYMYQRKLKCSSKVLLLQMEPLINICVLGTLFYIDSLICVHIHIYIYIYT